MSPDQEAVYLALLDRFPATETELGGACAGPSRLKSALAWLEAQGLASRVPGGPTRYVPAPPDVALEVIIRAREQELQLARLTSTQLMERYHHAGSAPRAEHIVEVVSGRDAVVQRWEQLQRSAHEQVLGFDRAPYASDGVSNPVQEELMAAGVTYRSVYDRDGLQLPGRLQAIRALVERGEQARVSSDVPVKMFIADDRLGLVSLQRPVGTDSAFVISSSSLLDSLVALFEAVWETASPLRLQPGGTDVADGLPAPERIVLELLAAGLPDKAIARQLGWHQRTVQRHVRSLMDDLAADTRFQAGLQAAKRGWL
jgi:sugar-specific transcriptional regulator TrmB/DNA-binding CsgD family transcriptional regulator